MNTKNKTGYNRILKPVPLAVHSNIPSLLAEKLRQNYDLQRTINSILLLGLKKMNLEDILARALDMFLSIPWLSFESTGSIFLADSNTSILSMKAQQGIVRELSRKCGRVPFGKCLCGRAAQNQKIEFASALDFRHEISHRGIKPHGHYCVPIVLNKKTLGVINIYVKSGHARSHWEESFLVAVANALAGIIQRKQAEAALQKAHRALTVLSECNRALIYAKNEQGLLDSICQIITKKGGYRLAWVGFSREDKEKNVEPVAHAGSDDAYLKTVRVSWGDNARGRGPMGTAIRTGKMVIRKDASTSKNYHRWIKDAAKGRFSFKSSIALPLISEMKIFGALSIYAEESDAFDVKEVRLLSELASDLAYGINVIRMKRARIQAEQELIESYKYLGTNNRKISILLDLDKRQGKKNKKELIRYVLDSAVNLSHALFGALYKTDHDGTFYLLRSTGTTKRQAEELRMLTAASSDFLAQLKKKKKRLRGLFRKHNLACFNVNNRLECLWAFPLLKENSLKGVIFLGLENKKEMTAAELEFYDVFSFHATTALAGSGIFA